MSSINKPKEEWIGYRQGKLTVIDKLGEKEFKSTNKAGQYTYKHDILLVRCDCSKELKLNAKSFISNKTGACRGCFKRRDDIGKRFGKLTVFDWHNTKNDSGRSYIIYDCICDCGEIVSIRNEIIIAGEKRCCSKCKVSASQSFNFTNIKRYYKNIRYGAKRRKLQFDVSINYLDSLLEKQEYKCKLSGQPISFKDGTASLDRIHSGIGYIESNVQWVHRTINYMKHELSNEAFKNYCSLVCTHTKLHS
jgi:hypothetical protein